MLQALKALQQPARKTGKADGKPKAAKPRKEAKEAEGGDEEDSASDPEI